MKNVLLLIVVLIGFLACKNEHPKSAITTPAPSPVATPTPTPIAVATHHCPMHPEVTGKEGDQCSKCGGMKLVLKK